MKYPGLLVFLLLWLLALPVQAQGQAQQERFSVNVQDVDLAEFIDSVGRITNRTFLVDPRVRGRVTIRSQRQLSAEEVYQVFLSQLRVNGFAVVELDEHNARIVPEQTARLEPIPVEGHLPPNSDGKDLLATRVIPLRNSDAAQLVNILTPLMDRRIGVITHYAPTNLLILTDWGTNLERLHALVQRIDQQSSDNLLLLPLTHASATEMEKLLTQLLRREGRGGQPPQIMSDNRLNLLVIRADAATRRELERLVADLDQPVERSANTQVFYLRHAKASEMVPLLQGLQSEDKPAEGTVSRRMTLQAHEATNALVASGSPDQLREIRLVIDQLDIRRAQVLVEAIIVEMSDTRARELGVQWLMLDQNAGSVPLVGGNFSGNTGLSGVAAGGATGGSIGALSALAGVQGITAGVGRINDSGISFGLLLNAIQSESDFNILSTPSILTLDNAEATILVGQEVPFITGSTVGDNNTNPFQTIQRREVGVRLQITPQINDGDSVRLEILQEVSNIEDSARASDIITNKREIKTTVMADNNDIIVLGGLIGEDVREVRRKVPLLGDIPLLGVLFRSTSISREKRNLMVFIQPRILHDRDSLASVSAEKYRYMHAAHLLRDGDQQRLLSWEARTGAADRQTLSELFPSPREQQARLATEAVND
ncbi:MAG: type II secretion system secretin GspD [Marinospirillum sp.]|uniref:type II secretion system secretin GspD n=1 Tax=Marinospirillum sp. TaxID=2183934 RepID=UPI0019EC4C46|nr:type II secretion system secretin GspD [Marinospirillum sp.]MBE0505867.1 type II secretion system secretin GspD [Marinospirillum sp.]